MPSTFTCDYCGEEVDNEYLPCAECGGKYHSACLAQHIDEEHPDEEELEDE